MMHNINTKLFGARFGRRCLYIATAAALASAGQAMAYQSSFTSFINPGTGNWSNPANWSMGYVPGLSDEEMINSNGTVNVDGNYGSNEGTVVGNASGQGGTIDLAAGGSFTTTGNIFLANATGANGTLNQTGGSINILNQEGLWMGNLGTGTLTMSGGTEQFGSPTIQGTASAVFIDGAGAGGVGTVNLSGGTITAYQIVELARGTGSKGTLNMTGGTFNMGHDFWGGFGTTGGQAIINQSGGTITTGWADSYPNINGTSTADGMFQLGVGNSAATVSTDTMSGSAVLNVNSYLFIGGTGGNTNAGNTGGFGNFVMNGGTLNIGGADNNVGNIFIGNAGSSTASANGSLTVNAGSTINLPKVGAIIAIGQVATTGGANGTGTLTINGGQVLAPAGSVIIGRVNGTNGANGTLNLTGGLLQTSSLIWTKASADVSTKAFNWTGGTLDVNSVAADFPVVNGGGTLSPGGAGVATPLTFTGANGSYSQSGSATLALDLLSNRSADSLNTSGGTVGTVSLGGNVNVSSGSGYTPAFGANFPVITGKSVTDSATWTLPTLASGMSWDKRITTDGNNSVETLSVVPTAGATSVAAGAWSGGAAGANFKLGGSGGEATISTGVTAGYVQFDSSGSWTVDGAGTLTIAASSGPGGIIAFGGSHDISAPVSFTSGGEIATTVSTTSLTIDGSISGTGTIEKTGPGSLTLTSNSSTFTGNWQISGGTVNINSDANLGDPSASLTMASGTLVAANGFNSARSIFLQGSGGTFNVGNSSTLSGTISGTGGVIKTGSGSLTVSGANSYSGATTVLAGDLIQGTDNAIPSTSAVVLTTGTRFIMNSANASIGSLANSGTGAADTVLTNGGNLTVGSDNTSNIFHGNIEGGGAGTFTKVGTGVQQISGVSGPSGLIIDTDPGSMINVNAGTLQLNNLSIAVAVPSDVNIASGATFAMSSASGTYEMLPGIHGAGSLSLNAGGGGIELSGNDDYTGGTKIQTGTAAMTIALDDMSKLGPDGTPITILPTEGATGGAGAITLHFLSSGTFAHPINMPSMSGYTIVYDGSGGASSASNPFVITQPVLGPDQIYYSNGTFLVDTQNTNAATNVADNPASGVVPVVSLGIDNAFSPTYYTLVNGTLNLNGHNQLTGSLLGMPTGIINLSTGNTLTIGADNLNNQQISSTSYAGGYSGILTGGGGLTKVGTGDALMTLANPTTANPAYTGPTTVEQGTLWFNTNSAPVQGTSGFTVDSGALLIFGFTTPAASVINQNITGAGVVQKNNNGVSLQLGGTNTYTGGTNITGGTLIVSKDTNLGASAGVVRFIDAGTSQILQFASGFDTPNFTRNIVLDYEGTLNTQAVGVIDTTTNNITASGTISVLGTGGLGKNGTGTLTVTGANTFNGNVYVNNGTLSVASVGASGGAPSNLGQPVAGTTIFLGNNQPQPMTAGTLQYTGVGETTDRGISLNGNGDINNTGTGTLKLTGNVALNPFGMTLDGSGNGELAGAITGISGVVAVNITNAGTTYNAVPTVAFSGGGGTGAVAAAALSGTTVGSANVSTYGSGYTSAPTVTLNTPSGKTGSGATAVAVISTGSITKQGSGTWTLSGVNVIPGAVNVNGGKLLLAANQTYGSLNVQAGTAAMTASPHSAHLLTTSSLTLASGASLDLTDNDLTVNYTGAADPISTIVGELTAGYSHGNWNGSGIVTSSAAITPGTTLGYADNTTNSTVQVRYTWYGDLDLSGTVDATDLGMMGNIPTTGPQAGQIGWFDGDLNYDGAINADDFALFQLGAVESGGASINTVPEPAALSLLAASGILVSRKRRK